MEVAILDPRSDERWAGLVSTASDASVFHHPSWLELLHGQYGYEIQACCVVDGNSAVAGLPLARIASRLTGRRLVALPFSDACPPLLRRDASTGVRRTLVAALDEYHRRSGLDMKIHAPVADLRSGHLVPGFVEHRLALTSAASDVERAAKPQIRRGVAKARREGLVAERHRSRWALARFYDLHLQTRRRQGVPIQPKRFILSFGALFDQGLGHSILVRHDDRIIAAGVFLTYNGVLTYKYGASDARYLHLRPNNLLFNEAIRWGCENGMHTYDLGKSDVNNSGLTAFKRNWGAEERALPYTYTAQRHPRGSEGLASAAVGFAVRKGPPSLGRLIGTALYKHVG